MKVFLFIIAFSGLYFTSFYNYLLFHFVIEIFTVSVSWCIFIISWNARDKLKNGFYLVIGLSYLFFGLIEILHTLSYKGMGIFTGFDANLPTQLWIAAGYLTSFSFLMASWFITRPFHVQKGMLLYSIITVFLIISIFSGYFPNCFIENYGLTPFKKISECLICCIYTISMFRIHVYQSHFSSFVYKMFVFGLIFDIAARVSFIFYINVYGLSNMIGHYFQLVSFYYIYHAFVETGISNPFDLIFHQLKQKQQSCINSERQFRQLFEHMTEGFAYHQILTNENNEPVDYIFLNVNESFEKHVGINRSDLIGKKYSDVHQKIHYEFTDWLTMYGQGVFEGKPLNVERFSESVNCWFDIYIFSPERGYFSTIIKDITRQKVNASILKQNQQDLEKIVNERTYEIFQKNRELQQSNNELKQLAEIIPQQLTEPIEKIYQLAKQLYETDKAKSHTNIPVNLFEKLYTSSLHLNVQTKSIIKYLYFDQKDIDKTHVDLNQVVQDVIDLLHQFITDHNAVITCDKLPVMRCNKMIVREIFLNLISNAAKYNDHDNKTIIIGCIHNTFKASEKRSPIFFVKDNGIGIDGNNIQTIFRFFNRLHPKNAYGGGNGVGLTLIRKMIKHHGGWILVDSDIGIGSTFYFML